MRFSLSLIFILTNHGLEGFTYYSGSNCGLSNPIRVLHREPTDQEKADGCLLVKTPRPIEKPSKHFLLIYLRLNILCLAHFPYQIVSADEYSDKHQAEVMKIDSPRSGDYSDTRANYWSCPFHHVDCSFTLDFGETIRPKYVVMRNACCHV